MKTTTLFLAALLMIVAHPARAHTANQQKAWWADWAHREATEGLSAQLLEEARDFTDRHPPVPVVARSSRPIAPADIEALIGQHFQPEDVEWALRVSYCESGWDANAKNPISTASGLFQVLRGWWSGEWSDYPAFDPFDPQENVRFAAWLFYNGGSQHWVCK